jgi:hypothetical protein
VSATSTSALTISVVFAALILAAAYSANARLTPFHFVQWLGGGNRSGDGIASQPAVRLVGFSELAPGDLAVRFSHTRVGHVLFEVDQSDNCRRMLFDNRTGLFYDAKEIFCGEGSDQAVSDQAVQVTSSDRLKGLQQSFRR